MKNIFLNLFSYINKYLKNIYYHLNFQIFHWHDFFQHDLHTLFWSWNIPHKSRSSKVYRYYEYIAYASSNGAIGQTTWYIIYNYEVFVQYELENAIQGHWNAKMLRNNIRRYMVFLRYGPKIGRYIFSNGKIVYWLIYVLHKG